VAIDWNFCVGQLSTGPKLDHPYNLIFTKSDVFRLNLSTSIIFLANLVAGSRLILTRIRLTSWPHPKTVSRILPMATPWSGVVGEMSGDTLCFGSLNPLDTEFHGNLESKYSHFKWEGSFAMPSVVVRRGTDGSSDPLAHRRVLPLRLRSKGLLAENRLTMKGWPLMVNLQNLKNHDTCRLITLTEWQISRFFSTSFPSPRIISEAPGALHRPIACHFNALPVFPYIVCQEYIPGGFPKTDFPLFTFKRLLYFVNNDIRCLLYIGSWGWHHMYNCLKW
jgi:hypothetical protein